jgi:hypothetical protein
MIVKVSAIGKNDLIMTSKELAEVLSRRFTTESVDLFFADLPQKKDKVFTINGVEVKVSYVSE